MFDVYFVMTTTADPAAVSVAVMLVLPSLEISNLRLVGIYLNQVPKATFSIVHFISSVYFSLVHHSS
jgi:hypothetical protein